MAGIWLLMQTIAAELNTRKRVLYILYFMCDPWRCVLINNSVTTGDVVENVSKSVQSRIMELRFERDLESMNVKALRFALYL